LRRARRRPFDTIVSAAVGGLVLSGLLAPGAADAAESYVLSYCGLPPCRPMRGPYLTLSDCNEVRGYQPSSNKFRCVASSSLPPYSPILERLAGELVYGLMRLSPGRPAVVAVFPNDPAIRGGAIAACEAARARAAQAAIAQGTANATFQCSPGTRAEWQ
jgi:hypothetical protein